MSPLSSLSPEEKSSYFRNVVAMAVRDGEIKEPEEALLMLVARELRLSQGDVDPLLKNPGELGFAVPEDRKSCFDQLYDVTEIMIIDGEVKVAERKLCEALAKALGYTAESVNQIIEGILEGNRALRDPEAIREHVRQTVEGSAT